MLSTINLGKQISAIVRLHATVASRQFAKLVHACKETVHSHEAKIVLIATGKSYYTAARCSRTFNSMNIPCVAISSDDILHGCLGSVRSTDCIIGLSKSGNTDELCNALSAIRSKFGDYAFIATISNSEDCEIIRFADIALALPIAAEMENAKAFAKAPTTSCNQLSVLLDLLAMEISECDAEQFYYNHRGGAIGAELARCKHLAPVSISEDQCKHWAS